jgi:hypothetical protein
MGARWLSGRFDISSMSHPCHTATPGRTFLCATSTVRPGKKRLGHAGSQLDADSIPTVRVYQFRHIRAERQCSREPGARIVTNTRTMRPS